MGAQAVSINLDSGLGIFTAVLGIVVILASVLAVGRASLVKAQLEALRGDRDDLVERVNRIELEKTELENKLREEIASRVALEKVVTGQDTLNKILELLSKHDARAQHMDIRLILISQKLGVNYESGESHIPPPGTTSHS